jgi:hypothetical protein
MDDDALFTRTQWGDPVEEPFDATRVRPGSLDARVLDQPEWWVDGRGRAHRLVDLAPAWRRAIATYLYRNAALLHAVCALCEATGACDSAAMYMTTIASGAPMIADVDPFTWLESTEFFRALRSAQPDNAEPAVLRASADAAATDRDRT